MPIHRVICVLILKLLVVASCIHGQTPQKIMDHGPDGQKRVFVVLGDGYSANEQVKFANDVDKLLIQGVFGHDFYKDHVDAFNVYRIDLVSPASGISTPTFAKNTALKVVYNGVWSRCWLQEGKGTDELVTKAASKVEKYDYVLILANEAGYGGCRRGSRLYVTSGSGWEVAAHEYAHAIAGLFDEYSVKGGGVYKAAALNVNNCSTVLNRTGVVWNELIDPRTKVPSDDLQGIDASQTVGEFTGCNYAEKKIYRPVKNCRMNSVDQHFCPVCAGLMHDTLAPFMTGAAAPPPPPGNASIASPAGPNEGKFMNIVVSMNKKGQPKIEKATEVTGTLVSSQQAAPPYFFAFSTSGTTDYAEFVAEDPYLVRGFADPHEPELGERLMEADTATIIVNVPTNVATAIHDLGMQFYKVQHSAVEHVKNLGSPAPPNEVKQLIQSRGAIKQFDVSKAALGAAIQAVYTSAQ
jgi:hypothetical protein